MCDKDLTWDIVNSEYKGHRLFHRYCNLNSCCEECNKKVRFWCKVKEILVKHQEKIIKKTLDKRSDNNAE
jgi:5-methylcytosine-specific restriction endonuclease McrA